MGHSPTWNHIWCNFSFKFRQLVKTVLMILLKLNCAVCQKIFVSINMGSKYHVWRPRLISRVSFDSLTPLSLPGVPAPLGTQHTTFSVMFSDLAATPQDLSWGPFTSTPISSLPSLLSLFSAYPPPVGCEAAKNYFCGFLFEILLHVTFVRVVCVP